MKNPRKLLDVIFPILGTIVVFGALLVPAISTDLQRQILVVLVGILVIEAGVWHLTAKVLPNQRKYLSLRAEVTRFIDTVRVLNARGIDLREADSEETREAFQETMEVLHAAVDRMAEVAGREG